MTTMGGTITALTVQMLGAVADGLVAVDESGAYHMRTGQRFDAHFALARLKGWVRWDEPDPGETMVPELTDRGRSVLAEFDTAEPASSGEALDVPVVVRNVLDCADRWEQAYRTLDQHRGSEAEFSAALQKKVTAELALADAVAAYRSGQQVLDLAGGAS